MAVNEQTMNYCFLYRNVMGCDTMLKAIDTLIQ
jgi:hypothetical protein